MDQRINSAVYIEVLSEPMNFPLNVSHRKEMRDHGGSWDDEIMGKIPYILLTYIQSTALFNLLPSPIVHSSFFLM